MKIKINYNNTEMHEIMQIFKENMARNVIENRWRNQKFVNIKLPKKFISTKNKFKDDAILKYIF